MSPPAEAAGAPGAEGGPAAAAGGGSAGGGAFVLAHLSDPHVPMRVYTSPARLLNKRIFGYLSWVLRRSRIHRMEVLDALLADLHAAAPDHVTVTGDIVNIALPREFRRTAAWLRTLGAPEHVTVVPGNHDAYVAISSGQSWAEWRAFLAGDDAGGEAPVQVGSPLFPLLRRRGGVALIGVSTAVPTAPGWASGRIGGPQLDRLAGRLRWAERERLFRVVLLHHPPCSFDYPRRKRLEDADDFRDVVADCGAELVLHGHEHRFRYEELPGPDGPVPVFGVPSASMLPRSDGAAAQYHLYRIAPVEGGWTLQTEARKYDVAAHRFAESRRLTLHLPRSAAARAAGG